MNDEELLLKYKKYIKKRNLIIIISLLFVCFLIFGILYYLSLQEKHPKNIPIQNEVIEQKDDEAPILELTDAEIKIEVNSELDYKSFIKSVIDKEDGDLKDKVQYSRIDNSKVGEYKILYYVFDSSNNVSQAFLKVIIEEPPKEVEPEVNEETQIPPKIENNTSSKTEKEETKPQQNITIPSQKPSPKYFLFEDGYTINNVVDACAKELKSYGGSGRCEPITNENGIYLGMKLMYE